MSVSDDERDRLAEAWLLERHDHDWYIVNATTDEWVDAYKAVDGALAREFGDTKMTTGAELIAAERQRQIEVEGWTPGHDASHLNGDLARAALCYAVAGMPGYDTPASRKDGPMGGWPWNEEWWKPSDDPIRNLVKAGALIAAEIDRLALAREFGGVSEPERWRKRPVTVDAFQFTGDNAEAIIEWINTYVPEDDDPGVWEDDGPTLVIQTLEGQMEALPDDWIIRGVAGEFYPCKDEIFEQTYERVAEARRFTRSPSHPLGCLCDDCRPLAREFGEPT